MQIAVLTGSGGLIGRRLLTRLPRVRVLLHAPRASTGAQQSALWTPEQEPAPAEALEGADVVFHLAGESIAGGRWTKERKRAIKDSRVLGTRHLVQGLARTQVRPKVLVCASAVGYYGDRGDELLTEDAAPGEGFLAEVCREWELEASRATALGVRVVSVRFGMVLANNGGALAKMLLPFRWGLGATMGSGHQWMSWVHISDLIELLLHVASDEQLRGVVNGVSPQPCTQRDFSATFARAVGRSAPLRIPEPALRLALGELSQVVLYSQRVEPRAAHASGFVFRFANLEHALVECVSGGDAR